MSGAYLSCVYCGDAGGTPDSCGHVSHARCHNQAGGRCPACARGQPARAYSDLWCAYCGRAGGTVDACGHRSHPNCYNRNGGRCLGCATGWAPAFGSAVGAAAVGAAAVGTDAEAAVGSATETAVGSATETAAESCPICLEGVDRKTQAPTTCGHLFHDACLAAWFQAKPGAPCPLCRYTLERAPGASPRATPAFAARR